MLLSLALLLWWLVFTEKRWTVQHACAAGLLVQMAISVPLATNTYAAFWTTYNLTIQVLCIMFSISLSIATMDQLQSILSSLRWIFVYVGLFAATHEGFGPAGAGGGQDENYIGLMMSMAIPLAYFPLVHRKASMRSVILLMSLAVYVAAIVVGFSRGAFLALCAVGIYCVWRSPRRILAVTALVAAIAVGSALVPAGYWTEMKTSTDVEEKTANMRIEAWTIALREFAAYPIFGVGPGNFMWNMGPFVTDEQVRRVGRPLAGTMVTHSMYFELLADLGLAGLVLFGGLTLNTVRDLLRIRRLQPRAEGSSQRRGRNGPSRRLRSELDNSTILAEALLGSLLAFFVGSMFISTLYGSYIWVWCGFAISLTRSVKSEVMRYRHQI